MAKAALENGADGYLAEPVDPDVLVATVRALLRLRVAERELARTNTALREANRRLESLNTALARSNRDLEHFAHIASHDLRDPLRTITSYVQLLDRSLSDSLQEKQRGYMSFVVDAARRMTALIDDLLTWSGVAPANAELRAVALRDAVEWSLENLDDQIHDTHASVIYDELPTVFGNRLQLAQLFQNLIGNSIKYGREGIAPAVHIEAKPFSEQEWLISVRDNGIGIAPEYHDRIFDPFKRLHGREIQGSGIGLAVCRRIVENLGGAIWVESQVGEGATFFFRLKRSAGGSSTRHARGRNQRMANERAIRRRLLEWYEISHRKFPWRLTTDPYRVWVSEIMLQQTRAATVIPYYERFVQRFPDVAALSAAPEQLLLETWSGLGYYSRARNMQKAARRIV